MTRTGALAGLATTVLVCGVILLAARGLFTAPGTVYSVAQLRAGMRRQPRTWRGRTVLVRALAFPLGSQCPPANPWCTNVILTDRVPMLADTPTLIASAAPPDPLLGLLRRVPLVGGVIGGLIPDPQQVDWEQLATYRVRLSAQSFAACLAPCIGAQLEGLAH